MTEQMNGHGDVYPERLRIDTHRHLISDATREQSGVMEYFDAISDQRVLTIPRLSEDARMHRELQQKRIPVYSVLTEDSNNLLLHIPNDARTVQSSVRFIARDVLRYKEIFTQVGEVLGRCALNGFGLPGKRVERSVLASIAFSLDNAESFGGNVHLLPPYAFDEGRTKTEELHSLEDELRQSPYISPAVARELVVATSVGWEHARAHS